MATQQNGVPTIHSRSTVTAQRNPGRSTNLPADYDNIPTSSAAEEQTQPKEVDQTMTQTADPQTSNSSVQPSTSTAFTTGEKPFLNIEEGPHGPLLRYCHRSSQSYYLVACTLESFLESGTISDISDALYQQELDRFIQDSRFADLDRFPVLRRNIEFLFEVYYNYETEVTFKTDDPNQDYSDEDLDDTLPYDPPPPVLDGAPSQGFDTGNGPLSQVDGASDYEEDYRSVPGSPAIWQSYAFNRRENQFIDWDHLGERLMRQDKTLKCTIRNELADDHQNVQEQDNSLYSEIDEVVDKDKEQPQNNRDIEADDTDMFESYEHDRPYMGPGNNFRRYFRPFPGQAPNYGHHQLQIYAGANAGNAPLYAPNRRRGVPVGRRQARGGRGARGQGQGIGIGRGRGRPGVAHPPRTRPRSRWSRRSRRR